MSGSESTKIGASPIVPVEKQPDAVAKAVVATVDGAPQIQYKIVRVRRPDGSIVKVKRPITAEGMKNRRLLFSLLMKV
jgi:hypothetical protein